MPKYCRRNHPWKIVGRNSLVRIVVLQMLVYIRKNLWSLNGSIFMLRKLIDYLKLNELSSVLREIIIT